MLVAGIAATLVAPLTVASAQSGSTVAGGFVESAANDGSVEGSVTATLSGAGEFAAIDSDCQFDGSDVVSGRDANNSDVVSNGSLAFECDLDSDKSQLTITLGGKADTHDADVTFTMELAASAFSTTGTSKAPPSAQFSKSGLKIDFHPNPSLTIASTLEEAGTTNDGSVTGSVVATLTGGTFVTGLVSKDLVSVTNIPSGLTLNDPAVNGARTEVTVTFSGKASAHADSSDVDDLTIEFEDGAFADGGAKYVNRKSKNDLTIDFKDNLTISGDFTEDVSAADNGSFAATSKVTAVLAAGTFVAKVDDEVQGVSASNVPKGLTAKFDLDNAATTVTMTLIGMAEKHEPSDDVSDLTIEFTDAAFTSTTAVPSTAAEKKKADLKISFGPKLVIASTLEETSTDAGAVSGNVTATLGQIAGGNDLRFVSDVFTNGSLKVSNVPLGMGWAAEGNGLTQNDTVLTIKLTGTADKHDDDVNNLSVSFTADAFTTGTAAKIGAPGKTANNNLPINFIPKLTIAPVAGGFVESAANDGSVEGSVTATLSGAGEFAAIDSDCQFDGSDVVSGRDANNSDVVSNGSLAFECDLDSDKSQLTITLGGKADTHDADVTFTMELAASAFSTTGTSKAPPSAQFSKSGLKIDFHPNPSLTIASTLEEAGTTNDGSVTGSVVATLTGGTFVTGLVSKDLVSVTNIPSGLTLNDPAVNGARTEVTVTFSGKASAHADSSDVDDLTIEFEDGAFADGGAKYVNRKSKNDLTIDFKDNLTISGDFTEDVSAADNGSFAATSKVTAVLAAGTFVAKVDDEVQGVSASNVPKGLTAKFDLDNAATTVTMTLIGMAEKHEPSDDVSDLTIEFTDAAFTSTTAVPSTAAEKKKADLKISFGPKLVIASTLEETSTDAGAVSGNVTATLGQIAGGNDLRFVSDVFTNGSLKVSNVPLGMGWAAEGNGLTQNDTVLTIKLTGTADKHDDDVNNLSVSFTADAFTTGTAAKIGAPGKTANNNLPINFIPKLTITLVPPPPAPTPDPAPAPAPAPAPYQPPYQPPAPTTPSTPDPTPDPTPTPTPTPGFTLADIELRDALIAAQEALLNVYRCMFDIDTEMVPGGCADGQPVQEPSGPGQFEGTPTLADIQLRDTLVASQEALLNVYRCMFGIDTEIVPGGCDDDGDDT